MKVLVEGMGTSPPEAEAFLADIGMYTAIQAFLLHTYLEQTFKINKNIVREHAAVRVEIHN